MAEMMIQKGKQVLTRVGPGRAEVTKPRNRTVARLRLVCAQKGMYRLEANPTVFFMHHGTARVGFRYERSTVQVWLVGGVPGSLTAMSLEDAVCTFRTEVARALCNAFRAVTKGS